MELEHQAAVLELRSAVPRCGPWTAWRAPGACTAAGRVHWGHTATRLGARWGDTAAGPGTCWGHCHQAGRQCGDTLGTPCHRAGHTLETPCHWAEDALGTHCCRAEDMLGTLPPGWEGTWLGAHKHTHRLGRCLSEAALWPWGGWRRLCCHWDVNRSLRFVTVTVTAEQEALECVFLLLDYYSLEVNFLLLLT